VTRRQWIDRFQLQDGGTLIQDEVVYEIPLGPLVDRLAVRRRLDAIFDYRRRRLEELLGAARASAASQPADDRGVIAGS
jgi:ligand-binding SRPBCC domain-containing protein